MRSIILAILLAVMTTIPTAADTYITQKMVGEGPYYLQEEGEKYWIAGNITTPGTAIVFAAQNVTLNIGDYTITFGTGGEQYRYGVAMPPWYPHVNPMWSESDIEIWAACHGAKIEHGAIVQSDLAGSHGAAVVSYNVNDITVRDVNIVVYGDDAHPIRLMEGHTHYVYSNSIYDNKSVITNRHAGIACIDLQATFDGPIEVYNNYLYDCKQWGIRLGQRLPIFYPARVHGNYIYGSTIVTNGYGIGAHRNRTQVFGNTITSERGRGIHIENSDSVTVINNNIDVREEPIWPEYDRVSAHGIKLEDCTNANVTLNTVVSRGRCEYANAFSNGAALSITVEEDSNNRIHNNEFIAIHEGGALYDPQNGGLYATTIEVVSFGTNSNIEMDTNDFTTNDRFLTFCAWQGPKYPTPVIATNIRIDNNLWVRDSTFAQGYDVYSSYSSFKDLLITNSAGAQFGHLGYGTPHYVLTVEYQGLDTMIVSCHPDNSSTPTKGMLQMIDDDKMAGHDTVVPIESFGCSGPVKPKGD